MDGIDPTRLKAANDPIRLPDYGLASLCMIAGYHGIAAEPEAVRHRAGSDAMLSEADLLRAAKSLGLAAKAKAARKVDPTAIPVPALLLTEDGWRMLAKASASTLLIHDPIRGTSEEVSRAGFDPRGKARIILLTKAASPAEAGDDRFDISWFLKVASKYKPVFGQVLIGSFVLQLFGLVTPLLFQLVIDKVLVHHGLTTLEVLIIAMFVLAVVEIVLGHLRTSLFTETTSKIDVELGSRMFGHLLSLPMSYFEARRIGDSVARVRELDGVRAFITGSGLTIVIDGLFTLLFLGVMAIFSPLLTLVVLVTLPLYVAISLVATPILKKRLEEKSARSMENQAFLVEAIGGMETLKAMAVEPRIQRRWREQLGASTKAAYSASEVAGKAAQAVNMVSKVSTVILLFLGAREVITGDLSVGQLIAFNMLAARVASPILRLAQLWQDFQQMRVSITRLGDVMNNPAETAASESWSNPASLQGRIAFEHVTFRYRQEGAAVLEDISFKIEPGEIVGLVGPSGSGKSTLAKLIQRLAVPERGKVLIDGVDMALIDPAWVRRQMGVVLQDAVLFNRTVRENIAIADPAMPMDQVIAAAELAGAHGFILELPRAYDTVIGERGCLLSGGQRQRLAIARALVTDPRILILDEATSALDLDAERLVQENMRRMAEGRTVLIISHRLATLRIADRILTLEGGRLTEDGTHEDLLRQGGRYAALHRAQVSLLSFGMNEFQMAQAQTMGTRGAD